ncbi:MAG: transcriptional regulator [Nitrospira sp.]|nr:MAG: transcriptional regulator [Nitrospira sp.]
MSHARVDTSLFELHAEVCKIFSHPKRLRIIEALRDHELTVSEVVGHLGIPKANVSQHLAVLRQKRVVMTRREGLNIYYRIANPKIIQACDLMRQVLVEQLEEGERLAKRLKRR